MKALYPKASPWSPAEIATLERRVAMGGTLKHICFDVSEALSRSPKAVQNKVASVGMSALIPRSFGRPQIADGSSLDGAGPFNLGAGDARYVSACLAQGGFTYNARLPDGRLVTVRP